MILTCLDVAKLYHGTPLGEVLRCCGQCHDDEVDGLTSLGEASPSRNDRYVSSGVTLTYCCALAGVVTDLSRKEYALMVRGRRSRE